MSFAVWRSSSPSWICIQATTKSGCILMTLPKWCSGRTWASSNFWSLSNAPTTFQALMNDVLRPFLRYFIIVFFDDFLVCSTS
jgi:hypothetical protein